jgi:hypothetical protein
MKNKLRINKYFSIAISLLLLLTTMLPITAFAENYSENNCSITVIDRADEVNIADAEFELYRVASFTNSGDFQFLTAFENSGVSLSNDATSESWSARAVTLEGYVVERSADNNAIKPTGTGKTSSNGTLKFSNLKTGLYLLVGKQKTIGKTIYTPLASLITLPVTESGKSANYNPTVNVKNSSDNATQEDEPTYMNLSVVKVWKDDGYESDRPKEVTVTLFRDENEFSTVKLNADNNWKYSWTVIDDNSRWQLAERDVPDDYTVIAIQDGKVFTVTNTYEPETPEETTTPKQTTKPGETTKPSENTEVTTTPEQTTMAKVGSPVETTTTPNTTTSQGSKLPQTGQLWWPVSLLSICGLVLILIGYTIRRKGRANNETK